MTANQLGSQDSPVRPFSNSRLTPDRAAVIPALQPARWRSDVSHAIERGQRQRERRDPRTPSAS